MGKTIYLCFIVAVFCCSVLCDHHGEHSKHQHDKHHSDHEHKHHHEHPHKHDEKEFRIAEPNALFAFRLYNKIASQADEVSKNIFFSPLGISFALSMLSLGAKGESHDQMFEGLGFNQTELNETLVNEAFEHLVKTQAKHENLELSTGGAVFMEDSFKPKPTFLEEIKRHYHAEGFNVNFRNSTEATAVINNYVAKKTHGKITDLVKDLDPQTVMYLLSYIFFKGKWEKPFLKEVTRKYDFHINNETTVVVDMMYKDSYFENYEDTDLGAQVLKLPYNSGTSMLLVKPTKDIHEVEKLWCKQHLKKWKKNLHKSRLAIYVPKFSVSASYSLQKVLSEMGITDIFSDEADLSGITDETKLKVSKIVHKAVLDVDETGSEAAAGTGAEIIPMSLPPSITFDRPFLILILDHNTKSILFMGKIVNPTAK
ncbi:alpha-1-antiproteinase-like [Erpetoichthys calabaricus]|uniref:alpha-1-antiproteinase-like n=1 Tax=Erpetoichthys calabaricus TaxID=27687 RepID=UPI00109F5618|nr:alpha-1-antiproteinase-like [Erpetoichthys calabaricus]XP_051784417.1 alpha-1-antiproteinase-like [Erpetoichthys calabaricus]XP_051784419.1 alpha-1-antiproteinase-like [Erpetoichthys calabaricus]XP_051784420.1 alpha-1-antiproteinase-like [Erpetoichthys calabaricus]